jgi:hypothetical protein
MQNPMRTETGRESATSDMPLGGGVCTPAARGIAGSAKAEVRHVRSAIAKKASKIAKKRSNRPKFLEK